MKIHCARVNGKHASIIRAITLSLSMSLIVSCSGNNGGDAGGGGPGGPNGPGGNLDLPTDELTAGGCLDLAHTLEKLRSVPQDTVLRRYTREFEIKQKENQPLRRNFAARMAKGNFVFEQKPVELFLAEGAVVTQNACESAVFDFGEGLGSATYKIEAADSRSKVKFVKDDGSYEIYELKGPREIEITLKQTVQDECPNKPTHPTHLVSSVQNLAWGAHGQFESRPASISRSYLKEMKVAVSQMPDGLSQLMNYDPNAVVAASAMDLRELALAPTSPDVDRCPDRVSPPSGEEPRAPREETSPAPQPAPQPTPAPPAPQPAPPIPSPF